MVVISKLIYKGQDITRYNNATIKNINFNGVDYHFAKANEVTGGFCDNAVNEPIIDMQIQGNSVQDGTPTLEAPIEIQSVGDRTSNLFNFDKVKGQCTATADYDTKSMGFDSSNNLYIIGQSFTGVPTAFNKFNEVLNITEPDYYCLKVKVISDTENITPRSDWVLNVASAEAVVATKTISCKYKDGYLFTKFQITQENLDDLKNKATSFRLYMYTFRKTTVTENVNATVSDFMFVKGDYTFETMPAYEPYGYKIPVKVSSKNLFNPNNWSSGTITEFNGVPCLKIKDTGGSVAYNIDGDSSDVYTITFKYYRASDSEDKVSNFYSKSRGALITNTKHNTLYTTIVYGGETIYFTGWGKDMYIDLTITQLEKGETATDFTPYIEPTTTDIYINEPLRMINDIADVFDYKNKKVIRNVGSIIYKGNENWSYYASGKGYLIGNTIFPDGKPVMCNRFVNTQSLISTLSIRKNYSNIYVYGLQDIFVADTDWETFLSENNMEVIGQLATPTEEKIEVPEISTIDGTTNFEIDTSIEPSGITINYWKQI